MRQDYTSVQNIYIICGKTDMRKGIDGLAARTTRLAGPKENVSPSLVNKN